MSGFGGQLKVNDSDVGRMSARLMSMGGRNARARVMGEQRAERCLVSLDDMTDMI